MLRLSQLLQIAKAVNSSNSISTARMHPQRRHIHNMKIAQLHNELHRVEEPALQLRGLRLHDFGSSTQSVSVSTSKSKSAPYHDVGTTKRGNEDTAQATEKGVTTVCGCVSEHLPRPSLILVYSV